MKTPSARERRRILFVSGVSAGGAPKSTLALARQLTDRYEVEVILGDRDEASALHDPLIRVAVKMRGLGDLLIKPIACRLSTSVTRPNVSDEDAVVVGTAPLAVNAALAALRQERPDVLVANSLPRIEMCWLIEAAHRMSVPSVVYIREDHALTHITVTGLRPSLCISNTRTWAEQLGCAFVPSIVEPPEGIATTREHVLFINPKADLSVLDVAAAAPEIPFVVQESWPMSDPEWAVLAERCRGFSNVEVRRRVEAPSALWGRARLLYMPMTFGRPRAVAEAHQSGIPVVGARSPVLDEVIGTGGVTFPPDASAAEIADLIRSVWSGGRYDELVASARREAARPERDPETVVAWFEDAIRPLLSSTGVR